VKKKRGKYTTPKAEQYGRPTVRDLPEPRGEKKLKSTRRKEPDTKGLVKIQRKGVARESWGGGTRKKGNCQKEIPGIEKASTRVSRG